MRNTKFSFSRWSDDTSTLNRKAICPFLKTFLSKVCHFSLVLHQHRTKGVRRLCVEAVIIRVYLRSDPAVLLSVGRSEGPAC